MKTFKSVITFICWVIMVIPFLMCSLIGQGFIFVSDQINEGFLCVSNWLLK